MGNVLRRRETFGLRWETFCRWKGNVLGTLVLLCALRRLRRFARLSKLCENGQVPCA